MSTGNKALFVILLLIVVAIVGAAMAYVDWDAVSAFLEQAHIYAYP